MNKLHKWFGVATALIFAVPVTNAQDNFYRYMGNFDHGIGREVIQSIDPLNPGYLIAGTAFVVSPNNIPDIMVSAFNPVGIPIWTSIYPVNNGFPSPNTTADGVSIAAAPPMGIYGVLAHSDFTTPSQSVLFQINLAGGLTGIWTSLGDLRATSVIYDPAINCFVVLGQAPINNGDLQLIVVDAATGLVMFSNTYDSGPGFIDTPSRLMLDPATGGYVLVGTSQNNGTFDNNVFVVRIAPGFGLFCSETFGNPGVDEFGVDVTWGKNTAGNATDIILCNQRGGRYMPFIIEEDPFACPGFMSSTLLDPFKTPNNRATAIATDPATLNLCICGENYDVNTNGFEIVLNNGYAPITYARYGQPWFPGDEDLTDLMFDAPTNQIIATGEHWLINPWPGPPSPPNQNYNWFLVTNNIGFGMCPDTPPILASPLCFPDVVYPFQNPFFNSAPVNVFQFFVPSIFLNECANPFREGGGNNSNTDTPTGINAFPNPASKTVSIIYNAPEDGKPTLEVTNTLGEVVLTKTLSAAEKMEDIDVSALAPGLYFFKVRNGDMELGNEKITIER